MNHSRIDTELTTVSASRRHVGTLPARRPLNRVAAVVQQENVAIRTIARRMRITESQARAELDPYRNLRLSELYRWQSALKVPLIDLLVPPGKNLSESIEMRAKLLKLMKTVRALQEGVTDQSSGRLVARIDRQLTDLMPELKEVTSWPSVGKPRTMSELGAITDHVLPETLFSVNPHGNPPGGGGE